MKRSKKAQQKTQQLNTDSTNSTNSSKQKAKVDNPLPSVGGSKGANAPAKGSRLCPPDWQPTESDLKWFREQGYTFSAESETEKMRDHEYARPRKFWSRAWRNWMRKAAEIGGKHDRRLSAVERVRKATGGRAF